MEGGARVGGSVWNAKCDGKLSSYVSIFCAICRAILKNTLHVLNILAFQRWNVQMSQRTKNVPDDIPPLVPRTFLGTFQITFHLRNVLGNVPSQERSPERSVSGTSSRTMLVYIPQNVRGVL